MTTPCLSGFWDQSQVNGALYIAIWSVEPTDFKNVIFEDIHWALFEIAEVAEETQNDENSKSKLIKNRWNPKFSTRGHYGIL